MGLYDRFKQLVGLPTDSQAAELTPPPLPKAPKGGVGLPGYRKNITPAAGAVQKPTTLTSSTDRVSDVRANTGDYGTLKNMTKFSPELGSSVSLLLRTAISDSYTVVGRNLDGQVDPQFTLAAHELLRRMTYMGNADGSFGNQQGLYTLSCSLGLDALQSGAMGLEVALDKQAIPSSFNQIAVSTLVIYEEDKSFRVAQKIGGDEIDLDLPTFIYVPIDQNVTDAYPTSPLTSAIQPILTDFEFNNDMRKALKRAVLPRLNAIIDTDKVKRLTPPEILADPDKYAEYQNTIMAAVDSTINGLNPEDALVSFDMVAFSYIDGGNDPSAIIERVQKVLNAKLVSGTRSLPVTLGFAGTSGAGSAESLLFLKQAESLRLSINEMYSRALTVAIRLLGHDGYVEFKYAAPNLKPKDELEAFKAMEQSRVLELLSIGYLTDEEACIQLTGHLPPPGAPKLSGTMFKGGGTSEPIANPASNTSNASEKAATPDTPTQPKTRKQS
jgi:hypothetical protein